MLWLRPMAVSTQGSPATDKSSVGFIWLGLWQSDGKIAVCAKMQHQDD